MSSKTRMAAFAMFLTGALWVLPPAHQPLGAAICCEDCLAARGTCGAYCNATYEENSPEWFACFAACDAVENCCIYGSGEPGCHGVPCVFCG